MSLSLTETVYIYLHPDRIVLHRQPGLFSRRSSENQQVTIVDNNEKSWMPLIFTLRDLLEQPEWKGLNTHILLSGYFLQHRIVKWHPQLNREDQLMVMQHQLNEIYGDKSKTLKCYLSLGGFRKNEIACAIDNDYIEAIHTLFENSSSKLKSIQSYVVAGFNYFRKLLPKKTWLILVEDRLAHFSYISEQGWINQRSRSNVDSMTQLLTLLMREELASPEAANNMPVYIYWPLNEGIHVEKNERVENSEFVFLDTHKNSNDVFGEVEWLMD